MSEEENLEQESSSSSSFSPKSVWGQIIQSQKKLSFTEFGSLTPAQVQIKQIETEKMVKNI